MAAPTTETAIWMAIKAKIAAMSLDGLPIAWPAQKFAAPVSGGVPAPYLRVGRVFTAPVRQFIDDGKPHRRSGSIGITVVYPLGADVAVFDQMAGRVAQYFKDGTQMFYGGFCVKITSYPTVQEGFEDNGYWQVPVVIDWECFA